MLPTPVQKPRIRIVTGGFWPNTKPIQRGARWDGITPLSPGIRGVEDTGTRGGDVPESVEAELRELTITGSPTTPMTCSSPSIFPAHRPISWISTRISA